MVFAASSLTEAFKEAGAAFSERHTGTKVTFNFGASSALATQINEGAPADVFASADAAQMRVVADSGNASGPVTFATNVPVVVVASSGSPVASFADLAKPGLRLVFAAPEVPIGRYARDILTNASRASGGPGAEFSAKVLANVKSNEANVRAVLTKVRLGEADAGIVYATDAGIAGSGTTTVAIPAEFNVVAQYPVAVVKDAEHVAVAKAWVAFLLSPEGQAVLAKYGFGAP
ncbi:MAG: molybdate ABC transporter substrate-binding protein [Dehalococcoidia bacterium]